MEYDISTWNLAESLYFALDYVITFHCLGGPGVSSRTVRFLALCSDTKRTSAYNRRAAEGLYRRQ